MILWMIASAAAEEPATVEQVEQVSGIEASQQQIAQATQQSEQVQAAAALRVRAEAMVRMSTDRQLLTDALLAGCRPTDGWVQPTLDDYLVDATIPSLIPDCIVACTCGPAPATSDTSPQQ